MAYLAMTDLVERLETSFDVITTFFDDAETAELAEDANLYAGDAMDALQKIREALATIERETMLRCAKVAKNVGEPSPDSEGIRYAQGWVDCREEIEQQLRALSPTAASATEPKPALCSWEPHGPAQAQFDAGATDLETAIAVGKRIMSDTRLLAARKRLSDALMRFARPPSKQASDDISDALDEFIEAKIAHRIGIEYVED
jgi:hypothetical protein